MAVPDSGPLDLEELAREAYYGEYGGNPTNFPITGPIFLYDLVNGGNSAGSGMNYPAINEDCLPNPADRVISPPTLTTTSASSITTSTASSGGTSISQGGSVITVKGVEWSTSSAFTSVSSTSDGSGTADFTSSITNLAPNTTYYVRAYATNSSGTGYGNTVSFQTATLPVTGLTWTTTKVNPCSSAPWVISAGNQTIRYNVVDSQNCGGTCNSTQSGTATATITVGNSATNLNLNFEEDIDLTEEIGPEDYVFVVRPDGMMKTMLLPSDPQSEEMDPRMKKLFKFFEDSYEENSSEGKTLH